MRITLATKRQIIEKQQIEYSQSGRKTKTRILNALEVSTGFPKPPVDSNQSMGWNIKSFWNFFGNSSTALRHEG